MSMPASAGGWTVAMLQALPDDGNRYEIIGGDLFVTPPPSYAHQRIVLALARVFADYLDARDAEVMIAPADVRAGERTSVEPDLFVIPFASGRPAIGPAKLSELLLSIEVLSPSTAGLDRYKKRPLYQREGVREYWIVDPDARFVERWRPDVDEPEIIREVIEWSLTAADQALQIDLERLVARAIER